MAKENEPKAGDDKTAGNPPAGDAETPSASGAPSAEVSPWGDGLDERDRAFVEGLQVKTPADLVKAARAISERQNAPADRVLELPRDDDPEKDAKMTAIFDRLGRPKEPGAYETPEKFEALQFEGERRDKYLGLFHRHGLSNSAVKDILTAIDQDSAADLKRAAEEMTREREAAEAALRKQWGGDYERRIKVAQAVAAERGDEFKAFLEDTGLGNDPRMAALLWDFAAATAEPGKLEGLAGGGDTPSGETISALEGKLVEHEQKYDAALRSRQHKDHKFAVKTRLDLIKKIDAIKNPKKQ